MNAKIKRIMDNLKNKEYKVVRLTSTEFELENGDVYPIPFEIDSDITVEKFQKILNDSKEIVVKLIENGDDEG